MPLFWLLAGALFVGCTAPRDTPLPYPLTVTAEAVGPIRPGEPYDIGSLRGKLPGFTIEKMSLVTSENPETLLFLKRGEAVMAHIFPDRNGEKIEKISVVSPLIPDHAGQRVGETIRRSGDLRCEHRECRYASVPGLLYRLDPTSSAIREITLQKL